MAESVKVSASAGGAGNDSTSMFAPMSKGGGAASAGAKAAVGDVVHTQAPQAAVGWGRSVTTRNPRLLSFDYNQALKMPALPFRVSRVDRLDPEDAGKLLGKIFSAWGIEKESEDRLLAVLRALLIQHAINGGSVMQISYGKLFVAGKTLELDCVIRIIGRDARKFWRAYADETRYALENFLENYNLLDADDLALRAEILHLAELRDLSSYPHLIHDSADACTTLVKEEIRQLQVSKTHVLRANLNVADAVAPRTGQNVGLAATPYSVGE